MPGDTAPHKRNNVTGHGQLQRFLRKDEIMAIRELARQFIIEYLITIGCVSGQMSVSEFVRKVYPKANQLPTTDFRFGMKTAIDDIHQHIDNNDDWEYEYLFFSYLDNFNNLLLCAVLHFGTLLSYALQIISVAFNNHCRQSTTFSTPGINTDNSLFGQLQPFS